ncbi:uncharacterized protein topaz1 [Melanotaenia boesemani]|uniref:uncharacterized protein topaz1 n=1 Tax=Melanotaenia boesemani TaxID=1250792 RepID=UPI001C05B086|nr:uncharacterized protein topaz1 [Melanotaenia boesemani]
MFPSSDRVKRSQVSLKDVVRLKIAPLRQRPPKRTASISVDSSKKIENVVSESVSEEKHASAPRISTELQQTCLAQHDPENGTDTPSDTPDCKLENCVGPQRTKRENDNLSCSDMEGKQNQPDTRDIYRNTQQSLIGPAGSERSLRRSVCASHCIICGECKYSSPQSKKFRNQDPKCSKHTPEKIIVWINQYPKVTLCDVAKKCDACSHRCSYMLPDFLKTKVVHCFKQDMRDEFRFLPICFGHDKSKSEEAALSVSSENNICEPQSLTEHLEKDSDSGRPPGLTTQRFNNWANEGSTASSAALSIGRHTKKGMNRTRVWSREVEEDPSPGHDSKLVDFHRNKRIKIGENSGTSNPAMREALETCDQRGVTRETNGTKTSPEPFSETDEENSEDPETFTCQRVKGYIRKTSFSCARTSMAWPFLGSSLTRKARAATSESLTEFTDPKPKDGHSIKENLNQAGSSSNQAKSIFPDAPLQKQRQDEESIIEGTTEKKPCIMCTHPQRSKTEISVHNVLSEQSHSSLCLDAISFSVTNGNQREPGVDETPTSPLLVNGLGSNSSMSTPSPSAFSLYGWETAKALSPTPSPSPSSFLPEKVKDSESVEKSLFYCEETQMTSCSSLSSGPQRNSDYFHSNESSPLLPQDKHKNNKFLPERSPPKLEPCYNISPFEHKCSPLCDINGQHCVEIDSNEFMFPPVLSPVTSPRRHLWSATLSSQSSSSSEEEEEEMSMDANRSKTTQRQMSWVVDGSSDNSKDLLEEKISTNFKTVTDSSPVKSQSSPSSDEDVSDWNKEEGRDESDQEDDVNQDERGLEIKTTLGSGVLTEAHSSPSSDEDDEEEEQNSVRAVGSSPSEIERERDRTEAGEADESQPSVLDEVTAYEHDILLVSMIQEDPELFRDLPEESLLRLSPARAAKAPKKKPSPPVKMSQVELERRLASSEEDFDCTSSDVPEESNRRPWRPRSTTNPTKTQDTCPASDKQARHMFQADTNNNHVYGGLESNRNQAICTVSSPHNITPVMGVRTGTWIKNSTNVTNFRQQKSNAYCRQYFSESQSCVFKKCRFQHLPLEGDEKLCIDTVIRFTKNPLCLQRAGVVFIGYYQNNPPGAYFSKSVLRSLLWALFKAGMVSNVISVLKVSVANSIVPEHQFLLDFFSFVRVKGLMSIAPELMQLTLEMTSVGLELSLDCLDCIKNGPVFQHAGPPNSPVAVSAKQQLSPTAPHPESINLTCAIIEIELCIKQEDWKRMGEVFRSICQFGYHPNQVERVSGRVAIALLSGSKDKLSLPFAGFAETVCQNEDKGSLIKNFVGRIGVSLILRYHKTNHWAKGCRVVEIMSSLKVNFTTLKSFFGNEDGASRCYLVTVAAELLLLSGSVEGALNILRENKWFLSSCLWPCEPADLESRTRVLMRLAEKTSHRDTLEVLCNLPGIKEPNDSINISSYSPLFNSHLQVCVDKNMLPVASDTVDFMLCNKLAIENSVLQTLVHKLGKQNLWLRAREVFKHSLSVGYYSGVSAPPGFMSLIVPCGLVEVELALIFEMLITVNASVILSLPETTAASLSITLKRTQSCESEYLSAGSCLLSAAGIPQPKLAVHFTTVNSSQEQVFRLDVSSARRWIRHNHLWSSEIWAH